MNDSSCERLNALQCCARQRQVVQSHQMFLSILDTAVAYSHDQVEVVRKTKHRLASAAGLLECETIDCLNARGEGGRCTNKLADQYIALYSVQCLLISFLASYRHRIGLAPCSPNSPDGRLRQQSRGQ